MVARCPVLSLGLLAAAVLALLLVVGYTPPCRAYEFDRFGKKKAGAGAAKPPPKKPPQLNTDGLPTLTEILEELNLTPFLPNFLRMGVTETLLLLRLSSMDYRIMVLDWEGVSEESINALKERAAVLYQKAIVKETAPAPSYDERNKLRYGRIYMSGAVQNFEYVTASFGGPPPVGGLEVVLAPGNHFGCRAQEFLPGSPSDEDGASAVPPLLTGKLLVAQRGNCTFLQKALTARALNASVLVIANHEDRLDAPASGHGIDPNITQAVMDTVQHLSVLSVSNISWPKLAFSAKFASTSNPIVAHVVPLKCGAGGICKPTLEEEKALLADVSWGTARFKSGKEVRSYEFLTSNFGGRLPEDHESLPVILARPFHGCVSVEKPLGAAVPTAQVSSEPNVESEVQVTEDATEAVEPTTEEVQPQVPPMTPEAKAEMEAFVATLPSSPFALAVLRGDCRFHIKQLWAESVGARLLIIIDPQDSALQRVGGMLPEAGFVGIPSILLTAPAGAFLNSTSQARETMSVSLSSAPDSTGADKWIELAFTEWSETPAEQLLQIEGLSAKHAQGENGDIVAWLRRRSIEIEGRGKTKISTDEL